MFLLLEFVFFFSLFFCVMAILDSPESLDTTSSSADNDNGHGHRTTLRRRPSARSVEPLLDSDSNSFEAESAINDADDANLIGNLCGGVVESASEEQEGESASAGLSCGKEEEEEKMKENRESSNGKGVDAMAVKFAYRPSAPAHRKSKESPLSSDAIFKQVGSPS